MMSYPIFNNPKVIVFMIYVSLYQYEKTWGIEIIKTTIPAHLRMSTTLPKTVQSGLSTTLPNIVNIANEQSQTTTAEPKSKDPCEGFYKTKKPSGYVTLNNRKKRYVTGKEVFVNAFKTYNYKSYTTPTGKIERFVTSYYKPVNGGNENEKFTTKDVKNDFRPSEHPCFVTKNNHPSIKDDKSNNNDNSNHNDEHHDDDQHHGNVSPKEDQSVFEAYESLFWVVGISMLVIIIIISIIVIVKKGQCKKKGNKEVAVPSNTENITVVKMSSDEDLKKQPQETEKAEVPTFLYDNKT